VDCPECGGKLVEAHAVEIGNIFKLMTKYSEPFGFVYTDGKGGKKPVIMGCYGIGISRLMGVIAEIKNDDKGLIWPKSVAPFDVHLVHVEDPSTEAWAKEAYEKLTAAGVDVLWDDREDVSAGQKFADADLIGIPVRLVVSKKVGEGKVEWKERGSEKWEVVSLEEAMKKLQ